MIPKYRAFYKANQKMYEVLTLDIIDKKALIKNNDNAGRPLRGYARMDEIELMQSTGLFDKNGKEIFEGDVVQGYSVYPEPSLFEPFLMGEVYYTNYGTWDSCSYLLGEINEQVEVIGNIYENKELIEVEGVND